MHRAPVGILLWVLALAGCGASQPANANPSSADAMAERAQRTFDAGDQERGVELATRALVMRIARHGIEHREAARSFLQLGDMRRALGQNGWARQSYRRGLEVLAADRSCDDTRVACARQKTELERALRTRMASPR